MEVHKNIPLKNFTTMRLGGEASFMVDAKTEADILEAHQFAQKNNLPIFVIGDGSNLLAKDEGYKGLIIRARLSGFKVLSDNNTKALIEIGAGENWDEVVAKTVEMRLSGIEAMSGIPGTAGATPVQNVGAYGQEIGDSLQSVRVYDTSTKQFTNLEASACKLAYRDSIFKNDQAGRYIITSLVIELSYKNPQPPFYNSLQKYLDELGIKSYSPKIIRQAVLTIRASKLPDPKQLANSGSFFKNAIIEKWQADEVQKKYPNLPIFAVADSHYKIPAGYLIETAGLRGKIFHGFRVYDKNAVVLVNESAKSYQDLVKARYEITAAVYSLFNIQLEQEPIEIA